MQLDLSEEAEFVNTSANKPWYRPVWRLSLLAVLLPAIFWYVAQPRVRFYFSGDGSGSIKYILNIQDDIDKGEYLPGQITTGSGHIFPNEDFFMEFYWENLGSQHCVRINPKWPMTNIYIGPDGNIDKSPDGGTDIERLERCQFDDREF